ncbi:MAG: hypothetical protein QM755_05770 [Luteolibacter sp.]
MLMSKGVPVVKKVLMGIAAGAVVFWAGRASAPSVPPSPAAEPAARPTRSAARSTAPRAWKSNVPGAGADAVTTASELRDVIRKHQSGASLVLSKMNADEVSTLVADLAETYATTAGLNAGEDVSEAFGRWAELDPDGALEFALASSQTSFRQMALGSVFKEIASLNPELARAKAAALSDPAMREFANNSIRYGLLQSRPDEWVELVRKDPQSYANTALDFLATDWAQEDPAAAASRIAKLSGPSTESAVMSIGTIWGSKDPTAAMAWAKALPANQRAKAVGAVIGGMAARDPDAAFAALGSLPSAARKVGLDAAMVTLADRDFDGAMARIKSLGDPADQQQALTYLVTGQSEFTSGTSLSTNLNPSRLDTILAQLPTGPLREKALVNLGLSLSTVPSEEAEKILSGYPEKERDKLRNSLIQSLYHSDPARALDLYRSLPAAQADPAAYVNIANSLAIRDPDAAIKLGLSAGTEQERIQGVTSALSQIAKNDPEAALQQFNALPQGAVRDSALRSVVSGWAQTDPAAALRWAGSLQGDQRTEAISSALPAAAAGDPEAAAAVLAPFLNGSSADPGMKLFNMPAVIAREWVALDPAAAGAWVATLPEGNARESAVSSMASSWYDTDAEAAGKWVDSLPPGMDRDKAARAIVSASTERDPAGAFHWADEIGDDAQRLKSLESVARSWLAKDPEVARAAIRSADMPEDRRAALLK